MDREDGGGACHARETLGWQTFGEYIASSIGDTSGFDLDAIEADYTTAITDLLPEGLTLAGELLIADVDVADQIDMDGLRDQVAALNFWAIVEAHALPEIQRYTLREGGADCLDDQGKPVLMQDGEWIATVAGKVSMWTMEEAGRLAAEALDVDPSTVWPTPINSSSNTSYPNAFASSDEWEIIVSATMPDGEGWWRA